VETVDQERTLDVQSCERQRFSDLIAARHPHAKCVVIDVLKSEYQMGGRRVVRKTKPIGRTTPGILKGEHGVEAPFVFSSL
jgi:hypothetical protein